MPRILCNGTVVFDTTTTSEEGTVDTTEGTGAGAGAGSSASSAHDSNVLKLQEELRQYSITPTTFIDRIFEHSFR